MIILVLALIVFGPKKLPEMGKSIGKGLSEFRKAQADIKREIREGMSETPTSATAPATSEGAGTSTPVSDGQSAAVSSDGQGTSEQPSA
jgi:TatA/E family protein of Tat protein translocase